MFLPTPPDLRGIGEKALADCRRHASHPQAIPSVHPRHRVQQSHPPNTPAGCSRSESAACHPPADRSCRPVPSATSACRCRACCAPTRLRRRGVRRRVHPGLPQRRAQPPRHVGHEAGGPGRDPRRVQADPDHRPRRPRCPSTCRGWRGRCTGRRSSARPTTASTTPTPRPSTPALTGHDRGEPPSPSGPGRTTHPAIGSVVGQQRPPTRPVVPVRVAAVHHQGGGRRAAAAGLLWRPARPDPRPALRPCATRTPRASPCPS